MDIYKVCGLGKVYSTEDRNALKCREVCALSGIDLTVREQECICFMGESGSGKTTLLKILGGIIPPSAGCVYYKGSNLYQYSNSKLEQYRRTQVGFIFQDYKLLDNLSIEDNIILPLMLDHQNVDASLKKVKRMAGILKIDDKLSCYPYELSGGQQQRAAICRALMNEPDVILADEPTGNLDPETGEQTFSLLYRL
ncbi:MAG: ABC transporter ATP-binding protein, partial [Lachnospiraceae bacterium]|nr:ABC transporter ATP-binding protein [Lachnospiraceae bacterium]